MCPSHFCRVRVTSPSSQSHLKIFRVESYWGCILLVNFTLSHFKKFSPTLVQVLQPLSIVLNVRFTTNGMCMMNNNHVAQTSWNKMITTWDLHCCLVQQWEALRICCSAFLITTKWCFDQDVKVVPSATFTKRTCNRCVYCKTRGCCWNLSVGVALKM